MTILQEIKDFRQKEFPKKYPGLERRDNYLQELSRLFSGPGGQNQIARIFCSSTRGQDPSDEADGLGPGHGSGRISPVRLCQRLLFTTWYNG